MRWMLAGALSLPSACDEPSRSEETLSSAADCACDSLEQPFDDWQCCADGSWRPPGDGACDGLGGDGEVLQRNACCELESRPPGIEPALCCADGTWAASDGTHDPRLCDDHAGVCQVCEAAPPETDTER